MLIKEVMDRTQLSKKAIRYYEDCGLFQTNRSENGYKDYSPENVERLMAVRNLRDLGFSIEEIRDYFASDDKKAAVLSGKLNDLENKLSLHYKTKTILLSLNEGQAIESVNCDGLKSSESRPYMYVKNIYLVIGVINLISFLAILIFFLLYIKTDDENYMWLLIPQFAISCCVSAFKSRRLKLKKQGIYILERKPGELIILFLLGLLTNIILAAIINDTLSRFLQSIAESNYGDLVNNLILIIFLIAGTIFMVAVQFFEDANEMLNFLKRRRVSTDPS